MPRRARKAPGGIVINCLNRRELFADDADYAALREGVSHGRPFGGEA